MHYLSVIMPAFNLYPHGHFTPGVLYTPFLIPLGKGLYNLIHSSLVGMKTEQRWILCLGPMKTHNIRHYQPFNIMFKYVLRTHVRCRTPFPIYDTPASSKAVVDILGVNT